MEDDNLEKAVESEEDKKEEVTVDEKKEEEREQEKNEEEEEEEEKVEEEKHQKKDEEIVVENREGECAEEKKDEERMESLEEEKGKKKDEEKVVENREGECAEEKLDEERMEDGKQVQVYQKRMKRLASKGTRGPSTRKRTRSQLVRTPFTQEKKKEVHQEIINISHHKEEEREKIRFYCKPDECTWDFLGKRKIKKKEEALEGGATLLERPDVESMGNQYGVVSTFFCSPQIFHIYTPLSYKSMLPQGRMYSLSRLCVMTTGMWLK
ncbi:uncharacterized protein LOC109823574 [Asparagus officinalis]|uniref:uncharacterized protein LOC109823574 n=1 Tax=Asparagus officinalis TaxID=4686 RepID=UPI00098DED5F|nr:uncharacterized protein LOC109823574 [Asparagus officinalis]